MLRIQRKYLESILRQEVAWCGASLRPLLPGAGVAHAFWPLPRHEHTPGASLDQRAVATWPDLQSAMTSKYRMVLENFSMGATSCGPPPAEKTGGGACGHLPARAC